jgi:hypothetical protein
MLYNFSLCVGFYYFSNCVFKLLLFHWCFFYKFSIFLSLAIGHVSWFRCLIGDEVSFEYVLVNSEIGCEH